jgi:hypothetical protein
LGQWETRCIGKVLGFFGRRRWLAEAAATTAAGGATAAGGFEKYSGKKADSSNARKKGNSFTLDK